MRGVRGVRVEGCKSGRVEGCEGQDEISRQQHGRRVSPSYCACAMYRGRAVSGQDWLASHLDSDTLVPGVAARTWAKMIGLTILSHI